MSVVRVSQPCHPYGCTIPAVFQLFDPQSSLSRLPGKSRNCSLWFLLLSSRLGFWFVSRGYWLRRICERDDGVVSLTFSPLL